jgi:hypothetical protein
MEKSSINLSELFKDILCTKLAVFTRHEQSGSLKRQNAADFNSIGKSFGITTPVDLMNYCGG